MQRWEVEHPEVPDGIAIIGFDAEGSRYLQHYFDSRRLAPVAHGAGLLAALRRNLQRRPRHDRRPLGELKRRLKLEHDFELTYPRVR